MNLADLHQRLRADAAPPSLLVDADGEIVHVSDGADAFLQEGSEGADVLDRTIPDLRGAVQSALEQAGQTSKTTSADAPGVTVGADRLDVRVRARRDVGSSLTQVLFDASPARAEASDGAPSDEPSAVLDRHYRTLKHRYQLVSLATNDAIWDWDLVADHVTWNLAVETLFGWTDASGTNGNWWKDRIHPDDQESVVRTIHTIIDSDAERWDHEYRFRRADGTYAYVFDRGNVLRDADGTAVRMIGSMLDLTQRREAEAALRESEEQYRNLFTSIGDGFCIIEVIFDEAGKSVDYRFLQANPAFEGQTGLTDVIGRTVREMIPNHDEHWFELYGRIARTGVPERFEDEAAAMGRWFEVYAFRVGEPEENHVAVLFRNVLERKLAEREIRELNATLEARVEERTQQVRGLAARLAVAEQTERQRIAQVLHDDLQQQLYGLSMVLALMKRAPTGTSPKALSERAERILDGAVQMTRTLSIELRPAILQADSLAEILRWTAQEEQNRYGLDVAVEVRGAPHIADLADRILLYQMLRELLFNVVKHSGGTHARLVAWQDGDHAVVRVEDDGAGFDMDAVGGDRPSGLGLFSIRERLELVGGRVEIDSAPGAGTRVTLSVLSSAPSSVPSADAVPVSP